MNDQDFALLVQRYAEDGLSAAERRALTRAVLSSDERRSQFCRQARLSLELGAILQVEDAEDAHLRASLIVAEDEDARDRRVMAGVEKRLRIGAFKSDAELRRSTRSVPVVRLPAPAPAAPRPTMKIAAVAAAGVMTVVGLGLLVFSGGGHEENPKSAGRTERPAAGSRPTTWDDRPIAPPDLGPQREAAEAKQKERARRMAEERAAMERESREHVAAPESGDATPAPPRRPTTVTAMARLMTTTGSVYILANGKKIPAQPGQDLLSGQGLETVGPLSWAALRFADGTRLELWADTRVSRVIEPMEPAEGSGKQAFVTEGTMIAAVAKQPKNRPFLMTTPHAEAKVLGTVLALVVEPDGVGVTRLEVGEGRVQFKESVNGNSVDVTTGLYTVATAGNEMKLKGIPPLVDSRRKATPAVAGLDPARVAAAVRRGVEHLRTAESPAMNGSPDSDELLLWTFIFAGVDPYDAKYQQLLAKILDDRRENATYSVSMRAMILEQLNRIAYQGQLLRCAQVLVDNQCQNGQWDYRVVTPIPDEATDLVPADPSRGARATQKFVVRKRRDGPASGDNSNSAYAAMGLRACFEAGIVIPDEVISRAASWWTKSQLPEGGWGYGSARGSSSRGAYGSITSGAVGSLVIYDWMRGLDWRKDAAVKSGLGWLSSRFTVAENPGCSPELGGMHYHYLAAIQRTGLLCDLESFGRQGWYGAAAKLLLEAQKDDGSWNAGWNSTWDTCFAILVLRRAGHGF